MAEVCGVDEGSVHVSSEGTFLARCNRRRKTTDGPCAGCLFDGRQITTSIGNLPVIGAGTPDAYTVGTTGGASRAEIAGAVAQACRSTRQR